jgi:hypothetical protein
MVVHVATLIGRQRLAETIVSSEMTFRKSFILLNQLNSWGKTI